MLFATNFVILRDFPAHGRGRGPLEREPERLVTMIDEELFKSSGHAIIHGETGYLESRGNDWDWHNGVLRYFTRTAETATLIAIYETVEIERYRFCPECGVAVYVGCAHQPKISR